MYFSDLSLSRNNLKGNTIDDLELQEIVKRVLHLLPEPQEISSQDFKVR